MKNYYFLFLSFIIISCGVFRDKQENYQRIDSNNIVKLNGTYSIFASKNLNTENSYFSNANEKFYRKYGRGKTDTIKFDIISEANFKILIKNKNEIKLEFFKNNEIIKTQTLKYKFKEDGFLYVKNKNTLIWGIPFLFGGVDVKKVRIALTKNNNLLINNVYDSSGAYLLIFGDAKVWENTNEYQRVK